MNTFANDQRTPPARLREARRQLLESGQPGAALADPALRQSWQRSQAFGLTPTGRVQGAPHASAAQLARALDLRHELVSHAQPVMAYLVELTRDAGSMVILADSNGMLLQALGDSSFVDRAERVALRPGATWHEQWRGTNAIGTALAAGTAMVVHGGEHYLARNAFLTCTAAPITDSGGRVLGVLDISGDHRGYHRHTLALVRSGVRMIEQRLFDTRHAGGLRLRLHAQPHGIGTVAQGLLALSGDGWLIGADAAALEMLGLGREAVGACTLDAVLQLDLATLHAWARRPGPSPRACRLRDGSVLWAQVELGQALQAGPSGPVAPMPSPVAASDDLARLDTGDAALQAAIARVRRVIDKPIAVLLQGESGVGKEVFAKAMHASGTRRTGPFVAVNCAALPEHLIEAELFGYRAGAFTGASREGAPGRIREADGGTLFLDEIGDMPLALQARLLRVLQERQVLPLGGGKPVAVDFRLVCATHRHLRAEMDAGRFREDLYYRLNGLTMRLPPLRERQDLVPLIERMLRELQPGRDLALAPDLLQAAARYRWPGNLRQLNNVLRTACALVDDGDVWIDWPHLPEDVAEDLRSPIAAPLPAAPAADLRAQAERTVRQVLESCQGNLSEAARRLGISRNTLYRKMGELGLR